LTDTLRFCPTFALPPPPGFFDVEVSGFFDVDSVDAVDVDDVVDEVSADDEVSDRAGFAAATHGMTAVVTTPAPMPNATASDPTRPMNFACPIFVPFPRSGVAADEPASKA
jgi:hypothetical protein